MALEKYKQKRDKTKTPEPFSGESKDKDKLRFVIQKHAASHLHYDFRLEMQGVLKSWAVPKGPSLDPAVKRLAMMVEDHPFDYRTFEGIIPKGQYGGGTVIVWDEGTYEAEGLEGKPKKEQEKHLLDALSGGSLKFVLHGSKLKGSFALVKTTGKAENSWLLIKHRDEFASSDDITLKDVSVQSGLTLEQVKETSTNIYGSKKEQTQPIEKVKEQITEETGTVLITENIEQLLQKAEETKIPENVKPMLATLIDDPFDDAEWSFEIKWDGYRTLSYINEGEVLLLSRNNKSFTEKYYPIVKAWKSWTTNALIDGEIMVIGEDGVSDFGALQNWRSEADGDLVMYVFDLLWYEGKNLMNLPLIDRQAILKTILPQDQDTIRLSPVFPAKGKEFFEAAKKLGLEGIIAKKTDSKYLTDHRSKEWLKIKVQKRQEVVIGGYTRNEGTEKKFSSLLLGVYNNGVFEYAGKVGTGFTDKLQTEMLKLFKPLITEESPFQSEPDIDQPSRFRPNPPHAKATWLKPELVCEINYAEITTDGVFRHPSFKGMRVDKKATDVVRERETSTKEIITEEGNNKNAKPVQQKMLKGMDNKNKGTLLNPTEETQVKKINGRELKFTHLDKLYWPEDGISKRDMFNYYYRVAEYILPYLKDRPLSLNRFPNGIHGQSFYQKDVKGKAPDWVRTFPYTSSEGEEKEYLVGDDEATLLWAASLGCIEMNPWFSRVQSDDYPDYCVIDLDPDKNTFDQVVEAALEVKKLLDSLDIPSYPKTSGSTGMHIYIPLEAKYTYEQSQMFAKVIVTLVHQQIPEFTSLERMVNNRKGKMYLDFLQNRPGATIASVYSLRPKPGATVSMALHWDEVKKGLLPQNFTIHNSIDRLKSEGDLFKGALGTGIDLEKTLEKAQMVFSE
ncbi:MAG TPA: DNA ligase D [Bacteroidales bacterium]|nr:DNA ligase D [Bacteroidales bacterium]